MCGYNLYIWHSYFGHAGTLNDINVWNLSNLNDAFLNGSFDGDFEYELGGEIFHHLWILTDGIYPQLARYVLLFDFYI